MSLDFLRLVARSSFETTSTEPKMDRKTLLDKEYASNKLNFSADEEDLKMATEEIDCDQRADEPQQHIHSARNTVRSKSEAEEGDEKGQEFEDEEMEDDDEFVDEEEEEEEEGGAEHIETLLKGEEDDDEVDDEVDDSDEEEDKQTHATDPNLPKPLINQNLNLDRNFVKTSKNQYPATPAIIKRRQAKAWFNSPTDSCLSPCTQKIFKGRKPLNWTTNFFPALISINTKSITTHHLISCWAT